jgi:hypothetical protein
MSNCNPCNKSILSQTPYKIGETQCTQPCPPEITCVDIIPSNCVFYSGSTLSCPSGSTSVNYGVTITEALNTMYQLICQNSTSNTVQITANDTCYGYLASKITSTSLDITVSNQGACEKLNIEEKCWGPSPWNSVTFLNKWKNLSPYDPSNNWENVTYSNVKECSVKLKGTAYLQNPYYFIGPSANFHIFTLPIGYRPLKLRRFSVSVSRFDNTDPFYSLIPFAVGDVWIKPNGEVYIFTIPPEQFDPTIGMTVSFDGIEFETN